MAGRSAQPKVGRLRAIQIELGIGCTGEPGIADIGTDAYHRVSPRVTQGDAPADGIFARQELTGERLAENDRGNVGVGSIEGATLEQADMEGSEIVKRDGAPRNHTADALLRGRLSWKANGEKREGARQAAGRNGIGE